MQKIVVATGNAHKAEEIKEVLEDLNINVSSMKDEDISIEIVEDGLTFEDNALIKARTIAKLTKSVVIADDSGLEVDTLQNAPGIYSARYAGLNVTYQDNNKKLLTEMKDIPFEKRNARFVCVIAIVFQDGKELTLRGETYGKIGYELKGENGFGYDPLFIVDGINKTYAELSAKEKNKISHRAKALEKLKKVLSNSSNRRYFEVK